MAGSYTPYRGHVQTMSAFAVIHRFLGWWWRELHGLLPLALRPLPPAASQYLWVEFVGSQAHLRRVSGQSFVEVGSINLAEPDAEARKLAWGAVLGRMRRPRLAVSLSPGQTLYRTLRLPLAARDNMHQVIGFELGRYTPFNAEQAWYDFRERRCDYETGHLDLELAVVARSSLGKHVAMLRELEYPVYAIAPMDELLTTDRYFNVLPGDLRPPPSLARKLAYITLTAVPLLLLALALGIPVWQKREIAITLDSQLRQAKNEAVVIEALRGTLDKSTSEYAFLLEKKLRRPNVVEVLDDLTRVLPDETWVTQIGTKNDEIVIGGETRASSRLVPLLEKSKFFTEASFKSPLVKSPNSNAERFQVGATIRRPETSPASDGRGGHDDPGNARRGQAETRHKP